jgi:carbon-monoxide dehydrogenase medium subunit
MKSSPFNYIRADSLEHALGLLHQHGDNARVLAGGQSLLPTLALRLSAPTWLIDLQSVARQAPAPRVEQGRVILHALTRHVEIERSPLVAQHLPLLSVAATWIAHPAIRNRGTLGGSLAAADPASEWPACALACGARLHLQSKAGGRRVVAADDFFTGVYQTALTQGEMIVEVDFPDLQGARFAFKEVARRRGDFATVGLAAVQRGVMSAQREVRWVYFGVADRPIRVLPLEQALATISNAEQALETARELHAQHFHAEPDLWCSSEAKKHIAASLMEEVIHDWFA